jgi:hypothetical protein
MQLSGSDIRKSLNINASRQKLFGELLSRLDIIAMRLDSFTAVGVLTSCVAILREIKQMSGCSSNWRSNK